MPIKALLIDLSGTVHIGAEPILGAAHAIRRLREARFPFRFCSNTSKESTAALINRLKQAGIEVYPDELFTSLGATRKLLRERNIKRPYLLLSPSAEEDFIEFDQVSDPKANPYDAVVVGLAPTKLSYENLNIAFRILSASTGNDSSQPSVPLFATHRARYVRSPDGQLALGPGPFVAALETAVGNGLQAETIGKPEKKFFEVCLKDLGVSLDGEKGGTCLKIEDVAVVGDDIEADLAGGAIELGLQRILVQTGKYREGDEKRTSTPPNTVFESITYLVESILDKDQKIECTSPPCYLHEVAF